MLVPLSTKGAELFCIECERGLEITIAAAGLISVRLNPVPSGWEVLDIAYGTGTLKQEAIGERSVISVKLFYDRDLRDSGYVPLDQDEFDDQGSGYQQVNLTEIKRRREGDDVVISLLMTKKKIPSRNLGFAHSA